ncbi:hypothetical protein NLI96_g8219 [Meripilus lineatus]|uniref:Osmotin, thaumatin-like protein n=1 Tax=Meripilus lineatus TaxID=2056292 RepID=A0AAD5V2C3_9APHY|nr:hypothetical protein NLI96_g8219 [Physisporinus lineatus]
MTIPLTKLVVLFCVFYPGIILSDARLFTVFNACPFTIWPALFTDLNAGTAVPNFPTGWEAPPLTAVSFPVPDNWKAGRIWGRRDCDFSLAPAPTCLSGWCNGGLLCDPRTGTGVPPASVAEWTLQGDGLRDFYDGMCCLLLTPHLLSWCANAKKTQFRLSMGIIFPCGLLTPPTVQSQTAMSTWAHRGPFDSTGFPVGCKSACAANLDGNPTNSPNCCSGSFDTAATCPPSGVQFYSYFKSNCPNAYAYAYDESSGTALWTCDSNLNADYTLTFCPSPNGIDPVPISQSVSNATPINGNASHVH